MWYVRLPTARAKSRAHESAQSTGRPETREGSDVAAHINTTWPVEDGHEWDYDDLAYWLKNPPAEDDWAGSPDAVEWRSSG